MIYSTVALMSKVFDKTDTVLFHAKYRGSLVSSGLAGSKVNGKNIAREQGGYFQIPK